MPPSPVPPVESLLAAAIEQVNHGRRGQALALCQRAQQDFPPHPGVLQLLAWLCWQQGNAAAGLQHAQASLALRPHHAPTLKLVADTTLASAALLRASGRRVEAAQLLQQLVAQTPQLAAAWFELALVRQDLGQWDLAAQALQQLLAGQPQRVDAWVNLGIVCQDAGRLADAKAAYGRALQLHPAEFGRIAHALAASPQGEVWLDLPALHQHLLACAAPG
jgi:tetratricopeptide (TPR) repeat protein